MAKRQTAASEEAKKATEEEVKKEGVEQEKPETKEPEKPVKQTLERLEARGRFTLFRAGKAFVVKNHMDQHISTCETLVEGQKLLADLARNQ